MKWSSSIASGRYRYARRGPNVSLLLTTAGDRLSQRLAPRRSSGCRAIGGSEDPADLVSCAKTADVTLDPDKSNKFMFFRRQKPPRSAPVLTFATTKARPAEEFSTSLAEKYDAQVKWMRERGITGGVGKKGQDSVRSVPKRTVDP